LKGRLKNTYTLQTLLGIENKLFQLLSVRILFRKSAALLDNLIEEIKPPILYKLIYREIAIAWKYTQNLIHKKEGCLIWKMEESYE
jgi:hypothetical protein